MSALAELQAGTAGSGFVAELARTVRAVAVSRNFPPPDGFALWDGDAVRSTVAEFMSDAQTPRRLADLAVHCATEDGLRARLQGTVRNFLADLGRRTPIGKLVVRINDVLSGDSQFVRVDGRWARRNGPPEPGLRGPNAEASLHGPNAEASLRGPNAQPGLDDPDLLQRAIAGIDVVVPSWGHDAQRQAPVADRETVVKLCGALLDAAQGSLAPRTLARSIGGRLGLGQAPLSLEVDGLEGAAFPAVPGAGPVGDSTGNEGLRYLRATEVLAQLTPRERLAMAYPELTVRDLAPVLGISSSQSNLVRRRAAAIVGTELIDDDDAEAIALLVMELARLWADTMDKDAPSAVLVAR